MDVKIKTALISVSDKTGVVDFARALAQAGVKIISTGGTARRLADAGVDVVSIDTVTGFPEMMDGRVKTLHPADCPFEEAIENIDIGGPSMIRSAAKNHKFVTVVTDPGQYASVIEQMQSNDGAVTERLRNDLARAAFSRTAEYDAAISRYLNGKAGIDFPERLSIALTKETSLRYGENPHQKAALYKLPPSAEPAISHGKRLEGETEISFNNLLDANAAFELVKEFEEPAAVVVKHLNPCGCAVDDDICVAYRKAYEGDVVSAFGGIIALNSDHRPGLRRRRHRDHPHAQDLGPAGSPDRDRAHRPGPYRYRRV